MSPANPLPPKPPVGRVARPDEKERLRAIFRTDSVDDATLRFVVAEDGSDYAAGCWKPTSETAGWLAGVQHEGRVRVDLLYAITLSMVDAMLAAGLDVIWFEVRDQALMLAVARDFAADASFVPVGVDTVTGLPASWRLRMPLADARRRLTTWFGSKWVPLP